MTPFLAPLYEYFNSANAPIANLKNGRLASVGLETLTIVNEMTSSRDENFLRAAPSSFGQSFQYLRDPAPLSFSQRNTSQASLSQSDYTASEQSSFAQRNQSHTNPQAVTAGLQAPDGGTAGNIAGLVCNVHQTTGKDPPALIGAATVISGDKLYVFGGRRLSRKRPQMTRHLYELDLIRRHWTLIETRGTPPPPRYFHSLNSLGDSKLVCYGGMTIVPTSKTKETSREPTQESDGGPAEPAITVLGDIHLYDITSQTWSELSAKNAPEGRYAHCATILPSSSVYSSKASSLPSLQNSHTPGLHSHSSTATSADSQGGAELIIVGGQDCASRYLEQINVFNLRSLTWTTVDKFPGNYGAYRTVVAPLTGVTPSEIGSQLDGHKTRNSNGPKDGDSGTATIVYSNYNFLDVKLELKIRLTNGQVIEKAMPSGFSPPGLRFPNGGVINNHFVVSGTYLTSTRQEYAFWALNLKTLNWHRVETGSNNLLSGSWNRGILWSRRNTYVILGDRRRNLADDYNQRRTNFSHICTVELEAFGLYDNPRTTEPASAYVSASGSANSNGHNAVFGGQGSSYAANALGRAVLASKEFADMEFLAISGERLPVNSHIIAKRWGAFFEELCQEAPTGIRASRSSTNLHPPKPDLFFRNSTTSFTPSIATSSDAQTLVNGIDAEATPRPPQRASMSPINSFSSPTRAESTHNSRYKTQPRVLYLPHTYLTIQALVQFLYTSSLPPITDSLCTPQTLCSLLQIARPYRIDGLLEAIVERLHQTMDANNTAAIFNAAAMAAGGGDSVRFAVNAASSTNSAATQRHISHPLALKMGPPRPEVQRQQQQQSSNASDTETSETEHDSAWEDEPSVSGASSPGSEAGGRRDTYIWRGTPSAVIGLQKRGLRGLVEGRRLRTDKMRQFDGTGEQPKQHSPIEVSDLTASGIIGLGIA